MKQIRTLFLALALAMATLFQAPAIRLRDLPRKIRRELRWYFVVRPSVLPRPIAGGAYTDRAGKIIKQAFGTVKVTIGSTVVPGDLIGPDATADAWVLADENAPQVAALVAVTPGVSGDVITAAMAVVAEAPPTGSPETAQTLAESTDIGSPLYLSATAGKVSLSEGGTTVQQVGWVLSTTEILIIPGVSLSGAALTLSGALSVGGVTSLADATTLATNKKLIFRDSGLFIYSNADGKLTISADGTGLDDIIIEGSIKFGETLLSDVEQTATVSADTTLDAADCGIVQIVDTDAKIVTLPATAAGLSYTIVNGGADGAVLVSISPNAVDKITGAGLTPADDKDLLNTKATAKKGDYVTLIADGADGWVISRMAGTWARE